MDERGESASSECVPRVARIAHRRTGPAGGERKAALTVALEAQGIEILVLDQDGSLATRIGRALDEDALSVHGAHSIDEVKALAERDASRQVVGLARVPDEDDQALALVDAIAEGPENLAWLLLTESPSDPLLLALQEAEVELFLPASVDDAGLARAIERLCTRAEARGEVQRLRRTIGVMEDCGQIVHCLDPGKLYPMALDLLLTATDRRRGLALFKREGLPQSDSVALRGFAEQETRDICRVLLEDKPVEIAAFERLEVMDRGIMHDALRGAGVEAIALLIVPILGHEGEAGVICIFDDGRPFDAAELDSAGIITSHAGAALQNAETYSQAKERAFIDDVTEVYNARYLLSTTENEIQRAERYGNPLSVLFLDLDRFKLVNDQCGHLVGSETLRRLARLLGGCVRQVDTLARYGGDEFTIVLVDTDHDSAMLIAERIRRIVEKETFEIGRDVRLHLSISVGVATCPDHGTSRDGLLDAADKAMYRAKSLGRNRVCSAQELCVSEFA